MKIIKEKNNAALGGNMAKVSLVSLVGSIFCFSAAVGCLITNSKHCGLNQGVCESGYKCSVCEINNNGCIAIEKDAGDVDGQSCEYNILHGLTSSNSSSESSTFDLGSSSSSSSSSSSNSSESESSTGFSSSGDFSTSSSESTGEPSLCGNSNLDLDEECDDGNSQNDDICSNDCKLNCGNGIQDLFEECDDGNQENDDSCSNTCESPRFIFVTSETYYGDMKNEFNKDVNLKGWELAKDNCNRLSLGMNSKVAGLTFVPWLGTNDHSPFNDLETDFNGVYKLIDSTIVARGFDNLVGSSIENNIHIDEKQKDVNTIFVWTGLLGNGKLANNCDNWTNIDIDALGTIGSVNETNSKWSAFDTESDCYSVARLYCIQVLN